MDVVRRNGVTVSFACGRSSTTLDGKGISVTLFFLYKLKPKMKNMNTNVKFNKFKDLWLKDIATTNITLKGINFAKKFLESYLDYADYIEDNIMTCDGIGGGGINIAYILKKDDSDDFGTDGDTLYLIVTEFGSAFKDSKCFRQEAFKIISFLDGKPTNITSLTGSVLKEVTEFIQTDNENNKIELIFLTIDSLEHQDNFKSEVDYFKGLAGLTNGKLLNIKDLCLETLFKQYPNDYQLNPVNVKIIGDFIGSNDLLVGTVKLENIYKFLSEYKMNNNDKLEHIYEKNVRMFLGRRGSVNKKIAITLNETPQRFGLYNNGITIVVEEFNKMEDGANYLLANPYIVNGCQTTKTIFDVLEKKLDIRNHFSENNYKEYIENLNSGFLIVKIVKATDDEEGRDLLKKTTEYTNSQNKVDLKDFIALEENFKDWAFKINDRYNVFLEVKNGEYDFKKAYLDYPDKWVKAFDLLKIYGAGWLEIPGIAIKQNKPFTPTKSIYKKIMDEKHFGENDIHATYLLYNIQKQFSNNGNKLYKYLFYYIIIQLLKDILIFANLPSKENNISDAVIALFEDINSIATLNLYNAANQILENYKDSSNNNSLYKEPEYINKGDYWTYLRHDKLGNKTYSPKLQNLIESQKIILKTGTDLEPAKSKEIIEIITTYLKSKQNNYIPPNNKQKRSRKVGIPMLENGLQTGGTKEEAAYIVIRELKAESRRVNTASVLEILNTDIRFKGFTEFLKDSVSRDISIFNKNFG